MLLISNGELTLLAAKVQIRMVAGFSEVIESKDFLVAGVRFELTTFGPESRGLCGTRNKLSARFWGLITPAR